MNQVKLHDAMVYICDTYPYPDDLSKARLTKLLYLADWWLARNRGRQITGINWYFNHYGPYVKDVEAFARTSSDFDIDLDFNAFGSLKETIRLVGDPTWESLDEGDLKALDRVMAQTRHMTFGEFLKHVYATYPIRHSKRYSALDLVALGKQYQAARKRARRAEG